MKTSWGSGGVAPHINLGTGKGVISFMPWLVLYPQSKSKHLLPTGQEAGWVPKLVSMWWQREKIPPLTLPGTEPWLSNP